MSSNIYNLSHPLRTGFIRLAPSGKELFGTVVKQGLNANTVTVRNQIHLCLGQSLSLPFQ